MKKSAICRTLMVSWSVVMLSVSALASQTSLIVPGRFVGHVRIGGLVPKSLGAEQSGDSAMGRSYCEWRSPSLSGRHKAYALGIYTLRSAAGDSYGVEQIRVESPWFTTNNGISTRSNLAQIRGRFRHLQVVGTWTQVDTGKQIDVYDDNARGIAFEVWGKGSQSTGRCEAIVVHREGQKLQLVGHDTSKWHEYVK